MNWGTESFQGIRPARTVSVFFFPSSMKSQNLRPLHEKLDRALRPTRVAPPRSFMSMMDQVDGSLNVLREIAAELTGRVRVNRGCDATMARRRRWPPVFTLPGVAC